MSTFRELFDEQEREDILLAMQRRESDLRARLRRANNGEHAPNVVTTDRLEGQLLRATRIINLIVQESN